MVVTVAPVLTLKLKEEATMSVQVLETIIPGQAIDPALKLLIDQQGITPVTDLDKLSSLWPANDDPDELLTFILTD